MATWLEELTLPFSAADIPGLLGQWVVSLMPQSRDPSLLDILLFFIFFYWRWPVARLTFWAAACSLPFPQPRMYTQLGWPTHLQ
jgi:hypothetical protein